MAEKITFYQQDCDFKFRGRTKIREIIPQLVKNEGLSLGEITIIFCSDENILQVNKQYLGHDYFTDIITFDYRHEDVVTGDLYISVDTVLSNSQIFEVEFSQELFRVVIHGVLHIVGYDDKTPDQQKVMRSKEDFYLAMIE